MRCWRARWKIENETFNTLKTQDYHFEHNFGHWKKNLSTNLALLMMLAFFVDQIQQSACNLFKAAFEKIWCKTELWEKIRYIFFDLIVESMKEILTALAYDFEKMRIKIIYPPWCK